MVDAPDDQGFLVKFGRAAGSVAIPPRSGEALRPLGDTARPPNPDDASRLSVDPGISLSGEVTSCDKLFIEGSVEAQLTNCRIIEIAEGGLFKGFTTIDEAEVRGRFEGDLVVHKPAADWIDRPGLGDDLLWPDRSRVRRRDFRGHPSAIRRGRM